MIFRIHSENMRKCGYGGIGRRAGFRIRWATMQVRSLLSAPKIGKYRQIFADFLLFHSSLFTLHSPLFTCHSPLSTFRSPLASSIIILSSSFAATLSGCSFLFYKADAALGYLFFEVDYLHFVGRIYELLGHESDSEIRLRHRENLICRCRFDVRAVRQTVLGEERRIKLE